MERTTWTDDRIDDMVNALYRRIDLLQEEMNADFRELRGELSRVRRDMLMVAVAQLAALLGVIATLIANH